MPDNPFPKSRVSVTDPQSTFGLPADGKAFVHFNFFVVGEAPDCPVINRIVIGQDRDAVGKFHNDNVNNIPSVATVSGTSRLGFGQVVVLGSRGEVAKDVRDTLIMIAEEEPDTSQQPLNVATRVAIAKRPRDLSASDERIFTSLQNSCLNKLSTNGRKQLDTFMAGASQPD